MKRFWSRARAVRTAAFGAMVVTAGLLGIGAPSPAPAGATASPHFVYAVNEGTSNSVSAYSVGAGGTLTQVSGSPFSTGGQGADVSYLTETGALAPAAGRLYVANEGDAFGSQQASSISAFSIDPATGALTKIGKYDLPFQNDDFGVATTPSGGYVFAYAQNKVVYSIPTNSDGSLDTAAATSVTAAYWPLSLDVSSDGTFLAFAEADAEVSPPVTHIQVYSIGAGGSLTSLGQKAATSTQILETVRFGPSTSGVSTLFVGGSDQVECTGCGGDSPTPSLVNPVPASMIADFSISATGITGPLSTVTNDSTDRGSFDHLGVNAGGTSVYATNPNQHTLWSYAVASDGTISHLAGPATISTATDGPFGIALDPGTGGVYTGYTTGTYPNFEGWLAGYSSDLTSALSGSPVDTGQIGNVRSVLLYAPPSPPPTPYLYAVNDGDPSNSVSAYSMSPTGALTAVGEYATGGKGVGSGGAYGQSSGALVAAKDRLYVANGYDGNSDTNPVTPSTVTGFSIDPTTGALTADAQKYDLPFGSAPGFSIAATPSGRYLFAAADAVEGSELVEIPIASDGTLVTSSERIVGLGSGPTGLAVSADGNFVAVVEPNSTQATAKIEVFAIRARDGALVPVRGSPLTTVTGRTFYAIGFGPAAGGVSTLFAAGDDRSGYGQSMTNTTVLSDYSVTSRGVKAESSITGTTDDGTFVAVTADPSGDIVYTANNRSGARSLSSYTVAPDGAFTLVGTTSISYTDMQGPSGLAVDPGSSWLYDSLTLFDGTSYLNNVDGYSIGRTGGSPDGELTHLAGLPVSTGVAGFPRSLLIYSPVPAAPGNVTAKSTASGVTVSWTDLGTVDNHVLQAFAVTGSKRQPLYQEVAGASYTCEGAGTSCVYGGPTLSPGSYAFTVTAVRYGLGSAPSAYSNTVTIRR